MEPLDSSEQNSEMMIEESFKNISKYPKSEKYNYNDLITSPNEIKKILTYLEKQGEDDLTISNKMKVIRRLITLVGKRVNNSLILNAMAKTYSKTPKTDVVQLVINALFANTYPTEHVMHSKSQHI